MGYLGSETIYVENNCLSSFLLIDVGVCDREISRAFVRADARELPVATESIDTLILPHVLEFAGEARRQSLDEAARVLKPEGRLFILGLNPWNPSGMLRYLPRRSFPWRDDCVSSQWLMESLNRMKFDTEFDAAFCISPSRTFGRPSTFWTKTRAALSFAYAVKAVKRRYALIPPEPCWINVPSLATGQFLERFPFWSQR